MGAKWSLKKVCPRNLYKDGEDVGRMDTPQLAAEVTWALNHRNQGMDSMVWAALMDGTFRKEMNAAIERSGGEDEWPDHSVFMIKVVLRGLLNGNEEF